MPNLLESRPRIRWVVGPVTAAVLVLALAPAVRTGPKCPDLTRTTSSVTTYRITNHLTRDARPGRHGGPRREWLPVWVPGCLSFHRTTWPHRTTGHAQPHGLLVAVADRDFR